MVICLGLYFDLTKAYDVIIRIGRVSQTQLVNTVIPRLTKIFVPESHSLAEM